MASVFISYSSPDAGYAARVYDGLKQRKIDAWYAPVSIAPGKDFVEEISGEFSERKVEESMDQIENRDIFIFLLSENSMSSRWCKKELTMAINDNKHLFVLRLDNAPIIGVFRGMLIDVQITSAYHLPESVLADLLDEVEAIAGRQADSVFHSSEPHLFACDLDIMQITHGDPYFKEGVTLFTTLTDLVFFLAPPTEQLTQSENKLIKAMNCFAEKDIILDTSLDEICELTGIDDLQDRIQQSKIKVIRDFLEQRNGCYFNNRKYGINNINPFSRTEDLSEKAKVRIDFFTTDYYTHRVMKDVCKTLYEQNHPFFTHKLSFGYVRPFRILLTSLGINLLLFDTKKDTVVNTLLTRRSLNSAETYGKVNYSVSVIEGVSLSDYDPFNNCVNLRLGAERGLMEELGVSAEKIRSDSIEFLDLFVNLKNLEVGITCTVKLRDELTIEKDVLGLCGKDQELEVSDKFVCPVTDLCKFVSVHRDEIMPQAAYTIGRYLQSTGNNFLVTNLSSAGLREENFILGKNGNSVCGDAIYQGEYFTAVIDGATPKGSLLWDGLPGDVFVAQLLKKKMAEIPSDADGKTAIEILNSAIKRCYDKFGLKNLSNEEMLQASIVIYSRARHEIWSYGDCRYMINGALRSTSKEVDKLLSRVRSFFLQTEILSGKTESQLMVEDSGRAFILPLLKRQSIFMNSSEPYGYPVLSGGKLCLDYLRTLKLKLGDHVVLSSDGYPELCPSLAESEKHLEQALKEDPLCMWRNIETKGLKEGNISYDDRSYISFFVR